MALADQKTIAQGTQGSTLMEKAGYHVTNLITEHNTPKPTLIICGPSNNGGDGWVVARLLHEKKWPVTVFSLASRNTLTGDAEKAAHLWNGPTHYEWNADLLNGAGLIIDAMFGIGLSRPIEDTAATIIDSINSHQAPIISIDIPSGINADTGEILGTAVHSTLTITFACKKPGHLLLPGKTHSKLIAVVDIGIPLPIIDEVAPPYYENLPKLWSKYIPHKLPHKHKYDYGHTIIIGGHKESTGASCLSAVAALRTGAGLATLLCPPDALTIYACHLTSVMVKPCDFTHASNFDDFISDKRKGTLLIGPGAGVNDTTQKIVLTALKHHKKCVLDADALTIFRNNPETLFNAIESETILTPHDGEFKRLFGHIKGSKPERALQAAQQSGATIILKGSDTIIASPDGRIAINSNASPYLATAGSGDVLAGIITGLLTQHIPAFEASCMGVWIHSETGNILGQGLISEDLPNQISQILQKLSKNT